MSDLDYSAKLIASDYVDFLLGSDAIKTLADRRGGKQAPPDLQNYLLLDTLSSATYRLGQQGAGFSPPPSLMAFAAALKEGFSIAFKDVLKNEEAFPVEGTSLEGRTVCVGRAFAMGVIEAYEAEREAAEISSMSLRIRASNTPQYCVCSNGVIVSYNMGMQALLPESTAEIGDLAIITTPPLRSINSPELLCASTKFMELKIVAGETLGAKPDHPEIIDERAIRTGLIYKIDRPVDGARFDPEKDRQGHGPEDFAHLARPCKVPPPIPADELPNAYYETKPVKLAYTDCPTLLMSNGIRFVDQGNYIVFSHSDHPRPLWSRAALFALEGQDYRKVTPDDLKGSLVKTSTLNEAVGQNAPTPPKPSNPTSANASKNRKGPFV